MKKGIKKIINVIIDIFIVVILIVSVLVVIMALTSKSSGVPSLFGISPLSVQSNSMSPTFEEGDLILCNPTTDRTEPYKVGDIVTFNQIIDNQAILNTHRIVEVINDERGLFYRTQGDNTLTNPVPDERVKPQKDILAIYTGTKIPGIGNFFSFIRTQLGFFLVILLPMILFFVYQAIRVVMNIIAYNKEKAAEEAAAAVANSDLTEEQKQRAIEEYLAKQKAQESETAVQTPADGESSDAE